MVRLVIAFVFVSYLLLPGGLQAGERAAPLSALAAMPVKEITVFKDGHAFVLHEGKMPTDAAGNVLMDHLPTPIIGTFWPYATDKKAKLGMVTAARRRVAVEQTALTLRDLIEANQGAQVIVTETTGGSYPATIAGFPTRSSEELEVTAPPNSGELLPQKGSLVLFKTAEGTKVVNLDRVQDVKFLGKYKTTLANEEYRTLLTLKLDWDGGKPEKTAAVGMAYLQKGMRWIPSYQIDIDGHGKAVVKLQATLLNELTDLENVTVNLVVGVPSFAFRDTIDPIALGQVIAQLSPYFDQNSATASNFSNSIMIQTQAIRSNERVAPQAALDLGPDIANTGKNEDLFLFTVKQVTLKKGQRLVLPVAQQTLEYKDVFVLDLPYAPPAHLRGQFNDAQQAEIARLLNAPKVMHKLRLSNKTAQPLTTAPALIVHDNRVLAQSMMTYTAAGSASDLNITTAVDLKVKKTDKEARRTPNAVTWNGEQFWRVDLDGTIQLGNFRSEAVELEVVRNVLGNVGEADHDGKAEMVNVLEDEGSAANGSHPAWLSWYNWPAWWHHFNGVGRITWKLTLEPGRTVDLGYSWHYYWR